MLSQHVQYVELCWGGLLVVNPTNAIVTYKDSADVQFTFAPMLSMGLSADGFTIDNLSPGTSSVSNTVTATVTTNSVYGYQLLATVGNSTYTSTDLVPSTGTARFAMIGSGTELAPGTWGYTLDGGTTYGALSTTTPVIIKSNSTTTGDYGESTSIQIGAYASSDQRPSAYSNVVNFMLVANIDPPVLSPYERLLAGRLSMQDIGNLSSEEKSTLLSQMTTGTSYNSPDSRDGEVYKISKLADGNVWLQDNLRLGSDSAINLTPADTNITSNWTLPASTLSDTNSYTAPQIYSELKNTINSDDSVNWGNGSHKYGVYYNYCAASGGSFCYDDSGEAPVEVDIVSDVCPKGWHMPTIYWNDSGEYNILFNAYPDTASFVTALSLPLSGLTFANYPDAQGVAGFFWSSRIDTPGGANVLMIHGINSVSDDSDSSRDVPISIRCMLN
ncbi:hypothetical protein IKF84_02735 [Candidatus Saccharibacteria bacterium]|nr:hypothetical protein [Candidatus Saccharibacteria bacterium]